MKTRLGRLIALFLLVGVCGFAQTKKVALVIGIRSYEKAPPLQNSVNDARDMAAVLKTKGFQVIELYDARTKRELKDAVIKYFGQLNGQTNAVGLLYYSGHAMQVDGNNYLMPASTDIRVKGDLEDQCLKMNYIMETLEYGSKALNIFIFDACRNNPFPGFSRSGEKGLNTITPPEGSYVVYATSPGKTADDGTGRNGLFTSKLLKYINTPDLNIEEVFKHVAEDVKRESNDTQRPHIDFDYTGDFYFTQGAGGSRNNIQPVVQTQTETQKEPANYAQPATSAPFDYGYGPSDAATVTVGSQVWISKNLNVDHFANGDLIPEARTPEEWKSASDNGQPAWCYYNNDPGNGSTYGRLYNWYAVHDSRGLAPKGWHVPSDGEWDIIVRQLANGAEVNKAQTSGNFTFYVTEGVGSLLKSSNGWESYNGVSGNGNNSSGIAGLPGGSRLTNGAFANIGKVGFWWSSTENYTTNAWARYLYHTNGGVRRNYGLKGCGFSVRCVRD